MTPSYVAGSKSWIGRIGLGVPSTTDSVSGGRRWFPYQKGGSSCCWYGNFDFVVDWENDGERQKQNVDPVTGRVRSHNYNGAYGFRRGFTWSGISGEGFAVRHVEGGFMFDAKGPMAFANRDVDLLVIEGFLNSSTATRFMRLLAPRLDFKLGHVLSLPVRVTSDDRVAGLVGQCIFLSRQDGRIRTFGLLAYSSPLSEHAALWLMPSTHGWVGSTKLMALSRRQRRSSASDYSRGLRVIRSRP